MIRVTPEAYQKGIVKMVHLAYRDLGSSRVAAQVLLSAYNGYEWQLDVVDLALLDSEHYQAALNVIRGRIEVNREPQHFIQDGDKHFHALWDRWQRLHISNRWKKECSNCDGSGKIEEDPDDEWNEILIKCRRCDGTGLVGE